MSKLQTVTSFVDPTEAHIFRGVLESDGIPAFLASEHHVGAAWPLSQALGGVRVQVAAEHRSRADELLSAYYSGQLEADLDEELGLPRARCPDCGGTELRAERSVASTLLLVPALLLGATFRPRQIGHRCVRCGASVPDVPG